jgi:predicted nucleotidyltransferase
MSSELLDRLAALAEERSAVEEHLRAALLRATTVGVPQRDMAAALSVSQPAVSQAITAARAQALGRGPRGRVLLSHRREVLSTARRHGARDVRVFGSVARGQDTEGSDVDLLVRMPDAGMLAVSALADELEDLLAGPVDVVAEHYVRPAALADVVEHAIAL